MTQTLTERDLLRGELNKAVMTRSRLESLCRELQKQNKAIRVNILILYFHFSLLLIIKIVFVGRWHETCKRS